MEQSIAEIIQQLTVEEKAQLVTGLDFWHTAPVARLNIPSIVLADGPHGLRKPADGHSAFAASVPATCFPSAAGLASSWNPSLVQAIGVALGEECLANGVHVLLGPAINIKRSPLGGRNFEYFAEDPHLTAILAIAYITGVQSQGVGTSLKHFAANNQEHRRMTTDTIVDERTLRQIYLAAFGQTISVMPPWTVMSAYNRLNGFSCSENSWLLNAVLRHDWHYEGLVVSDWGAVDQRIPALKAGLDLQMPGPNLEANRSIVQSIHDQTLAEAVLDRAVARVLALVFRATAERPVDTGYDREAHHQLARLAAQESAVLLKNDEVILPLAPDRTLAVVGAFAKHPRYQGGGSSHVEPTRLDSLWDSLLAASAAITYADGYDPQSGVIDPARLTEAVACAAEADVVVVAVGLLESAESEGYDRQDLRLPPSHEALIRAVSAVNSQVVVVLSNGAPVEMPWLPEVKAVLECYLGGQAGGSAAADLLTGAANPSGRLAETFPVNLADNPSYLNFPGAHDRVEYREGIFVGYRYYDAKAMAPLFPFGFGLSYTNFSYRDLTLSHQELSDGDPLTVSVRVKNVGSRPGQEVVQLYVSPPPQVGITQPLHQLQGFDKVWLEAGQEVLVSFRLEPRAFSHYDALSQSWATTPGVYSIAIGRSSREFTLTCTMVVTPSAKQSPAPITRQTTLGELLADPATAAVLQPLFERFGQSAGLSDGVEQNPEFTAAFLADLPLRAIITFSEGQLGEAELAALIAQLTNARSQA